MNKTKPYPSDLTDEQWELVRPFLPGPSRYGRRRTVDRRALVDAILYILRTGCQWRQLPHDFPPWGTASSQFYRWRVSGVWQRVHDALYARVRKQEGRKPSPTTGIIDTQSVRTTEAGGPRGYDAAKEVTGRKRHVVVDTLGLLIACAVHPADVQDYDGAEWVLDKVKERFPRLKRVYADGIYACKLLPLCVWVIYRLALKVVERLPGVRGFSVLMHRWRVERTFGWLGRNRRLSKDYERSPQVSETMIYIAMTHLMLKRLRPAKC
jgi:putative transposase